MRTRLRNRIKLKVMVTGRNQRVAANIADHLSNEKGYPVSRCDVGEDAMARKFLFALPQVVVICLSDETAESCGSYDVLLECENPNWLLTIVVADKNDYRIFKDHTELTNYFYLSRPVSMDALNAKLGEIEKRVEMDLQYESAHRSRRSNKTDDWTGTDGKKRILVVDDDKEQLILLKQHLTPFYDVRVARSGAAALGYLKEHRIDLLLLDYMMPEMDGPAVLTILRESGEYPWIPVVFLTGISERKRVIKTLVDFKPQGYIVKPVKKSELIAKIIEVIG